MSKKCETVIISDKAYNAMIRESFAKHPVETGGILLGYILDNGLWVVMEMIPPGINGVFETAYFEYDQDFVNYLGTSVANQYKEPLQVLGLWHRHPGSMDYFSSTDDGTNSEFASKNPYGVISGLVNIDPSFRLTMYHLDHNNGVRPRNIAYSTVGVEVGDDLIPEKFFALRYVDEERSELHPTPTHTNTKVAQTRSVPKSPRNGSDDETLDQTTLEDSEKASVKTATSSDKSHKSKFRKWFIPSIAIVIFLIGAFCGVKVAPLLKSSAEEQVNQVTTQQDTKEEEPAPLNNESVKSDNKDDSKNNESTASDKVNSEEPSTVANLENPDTNTSDNDDKH